MSKTIDQLFGSEDATADSFVRNLLVSCSQGVRVSNSIPADADFEFESTDKEFKTLSDEAKENVLDLCIRIGNITGHDLSAWIGEGDKCMDSAFFEEIETMIESLLENADLQLDEFQAKSEPSSSSKSPKSDKIKTKFDSLDQDQDIEKPQLQFENTFDNSRETHFMPKIRTKPHSMIPLDLKPKTLSSALSTRGGSGGAGTEDGDLEVEVGEDIVDVTDGANNDTSIGPDVHCLHP